MCVEHLQFSTAFSDSYQIFAFGGLHNIELVFDNPDDISDIKKSGLGIFTYCAGALEMVASTVMTSLLWIGGSGHSKYVPILGNRPTSY